MLPLARMPAPGNDVDSSVIGIVATADDADAELFPLNKPTLLTRVNDMLGKCGTTGTLYRALKAIADQVSTKVIVVRVAEHKEEDGKTQDQLVIGGSESDGSYTGMYALLVAEQDESIGYRPRILAAPELDTEAVTKSLCVIAGKLRAFVYASCHGCDTMADAITYRQKFNEREVMLLWPDFIAYNPKSGKNETFPAPAYACGLRAYIDHEQGWHKSLSNVPVGGFFRGPVLCDELLVYHMTSPFVNTGPSLQMRLLPYLVLHEQPMQAPKPQPMRSSNESCPSCGTASHNARSIGSGPQA